MIGTLRRRGRAPFLRTPTGTLSGADAARRVNEISEQLRKRGAEPGTAIALDALPDEETILTLIAIWDSECIAVPMNPKWTERERAGITARLPLRLDLGPNGTPNANAHAIGPFATIVATAGSTGVPKLALHSRANHESSARGFLDAFPAGAPDDFHLQLPLHHVGGLALLFRAFACGATLSTPDPEQRASSDLRRLRPSHVSFVPTQLHRLLAEEPDSLESLRLILLGGASVSGTLRREAVRRELPVVVSYGLTEMSSIVTATNEPAFVSREGLAGAVLPERRLRVRDGEIEVGGAPLFAGYWRDGSIETKREEGWFRTGDLGTLDEAGYLFVSGRRDALFISGGENVHPEEIEAALLEHPGITDVIVVDVPNEEFGARPVAFVSLEMDVRADALRAFLRERLAAFKIPDAFWRLPAKVSLKPSRHRLRRLAADPEGRDLRPLA